MEECNLIPARLNSFIHVIRDCTQFTPRLIGPDTSHQRIPIFISWPSGRTNVHLIDVHQDCPHENGIELCLTFPSGRHGQAHVPESVWSGQEVRSSCIIQFSLSNAFFWETLKLIWAIYVAPLGMPSHELHLNTEGGSLSPRPMFIGVGVCNPFQI